MDSRGVFVTLAIEDYAWFALIAKQTGMSLQELLSSELAMIADDDRNEEDLHPEAKAAGGPCGLRIVK